MGIFGRRQRQKLLAGRRGPDFAPGDDAVCIEDGPWTNFGTGDSNCTGPPKGGCYRVIGVVVEYDCHLISLKGWPLWYTADSFRKLQRDTSHDKLHEECPQLMKWQRKRVHEFVQELRELLQFMDTIA